MHTEHPAILRYAKWLTRRRGLPFAVARLMAELAFSQPARRA